MAIFEGAGVAIITPMKQDGSVDFDELRKIIDFQIDNGTDSIIICGTTGESSVLSDEEHMECFRVAVDQVNGRVPVIAGSVLTVQNQQFTILKKHRNMEQMQFFLLLHITIRLHRTDLRHIILQLQKQ